MKGHARPCRAMQAQSTRRWRCCSGRVWKRLRGRGPQRPQARDQTSPILASSRCAECRALRSPLKAPRCSPSSVQPTGQRAVLRREEAMAVPSPGPELPRQKNTAAIFFPTDRHSQSGLAPGGCRHLVCGTLADDPALPAVHSTRDFLSRGLRGASCATVPCAKPLQSQGWGGRVGESGESRTKTKVPVTDKIVLSTSRSKKVQPELVQTCWPVCG